MIKINEKYRVVLTVHDAAVCVVPEDEAEEAKAWIMDIMSTPPDWAVSLPVSCEASYAQSYGEC
jgi:DNA polymerase I-like protein with 3'-5' exonuclease and polymerase domains